jgi:hypothetical protein
VELKLIAAIEMNWPGVSTCAFAEVQEAGFPSVVVVTVHTMLDPLRKFPLTEEADPMARTKLAVAGAEVPA